MRAALVSGVGVVGFLTWRHADSKFVFAVAAVTALIVFKYYQNYLFVTFRSKNSFLDLAKAQVVDQPPPCCRCCCCWFWDITACLNALCDRRLRGSLYLMHRTRPMQVTPTWRTESFSLLLRTGIPIFVTDYIGNCAGTVDRVVLLRFGGIEQVGLDALAVSTMAAFQVVPQSIAHYAYPRMSHHYGRTNNPKVLWGMAWKTNLVE